VEAAMPGVSEEKYAKMKSRYRSDVAQFIASKGATLTYSDIAGKFGGIARGYGDVLGGITIFCKENGYPLLPVLVVAKKTGRPSEGAALYRDFGLITRTQMDEEQRKCIGWDWKKVEF
jgi:hypothetical protein